MHLLTAPETGLVNRDTSDVPGGFLAFGFVLLVTASEAALTLPDQNAHARFVASFYAHHRAAILVLQVAGLVAAALLAGYAVRLAAIDRSVAGSGLLLALLACAPGSATMVLAVVADPAAPGAAGRWNDVLPRADDLLFVGIIAFAAAVAIQLRHHRVAATLGALVCLLCLSRLALEATHRPLGLLESVGPLAFLALVSVLGWMSLRGLLTTTDRAHGS